MGHSVDLSNYQIRTDLAIEAINDKTIEGIVSKKVVENGITITNVNVNEIGSKKIGKKKGNYVTIEFDDVTDYEKKC